MHHIIGLFNKDTPDANELLKLFNVLKSKQDDEHTSWSMDGKRIPDFNFSTSFKLNHFSDDGWTLLSISSEKKEVGL